MIPHSVEVWLTEWVVETVEDDAEDAVGAADGGARGIAVLPDQQAELAV